MSQTNLDTHIRKYHAKKFDFETVFLTPETPETDIPDLPESEIDDLTADESGEELPERQKGTKKKLFPDLPTPSIQSTPAFPLSEITSEPDAVFSDDTVTQKPNKTRQRVVSFVSQFSTPPASDEEEVEEHLLYKMNKQNIQNQDRSIVQIGDSLTFSRLKKLNNLNSNFFIFYFKLRKNIVTYKIQKILS